ncbi:hypothetical protein HW555_010316 [Spodoptera exigua]|uniref:Uncharacterized protein n=1 Tax=Spodoptera exigua TaxID=7107 RepID=A0A835GBB8_SPOEX|nr:hypothetical protein HW555_010316 [Spodoptera exigua]KAH9638786.1 hypothetical protein HF086_002026 [Spodoptera exigua]
MFTSYEVFATFGISAILSFTLSVALLLVLAAKRGLLRVGARNKPVKFNPLLIPGGPITPITSKIVELTPLKDPTHI